LANGTYSLSSVAVANSSSPTPLAQVRWPGQPETLPPGFSANPPAEIQSVTSTLTGVIDAITLNTIANGVNSDNEFVSVGPFITFGLQNMALDAAKITANVTPVANTSANWNVEYVWPFTQGANVAAPTGPGTYRGNIWYYPGTYPNVSTILNSQSRGWTSEMVFNQSPEDPIANVSITYAPPDGFAPVVPNQFSDLVSNAISLGGISQVQNNPRYARITLSGNIPTDGIWNQNGYNFFTTGNTGVVNNLVSNVTVTTNSGQQVSQIVPIRFDVDQFKGPYDTLTTNNVATYGLSNDFRSLVVTRLVKMSFVLDHLTSGPTYPNMRPNGVATFDAFKTVLSVSNLRGQRHTYNTSITPEANTLFYRIFLARADLTTKAAFDALSEASASWTNPATQKIFIGQFTPTLFRNDPLGPPRPPINITPAPLYMPAVRIDQALSNSTALFPAQTIRQTFGIYVEMVGSVPIGSPGEWPSTDNIYMPEFDVIVEKTDQVPTIVSKPLELLRTVTWDRQNIT